MNHKGCPFCKHEKANIYKADQPLRFAQEITKNILICRECGILYPESRISSEIAAEFWKDHFSQEMLEKNYNAKVRNSPKFIMTRVIKELEFPTESSALDIGSFTGGFLYSLEQAGFVAKGLEANRMAADLASAKGHRSFHGIFPHGIPPELTRDRYDLISLLETIYYLDDLRAALQLIHALLKDNGVLLIKSINGANNEFQDPKVSYFKRVGDFIQGMVTWDSMIHILEKTNFKIIMRRRTFEDFLKNYYGISLPNKLIQAAFNKFLPKFIFPPGRSHRFYLVAMKS